MTSKTDATPCRSAALRWMAAQAAVFVAVGLIVYWPFFDPGEPNAVGRYDVFRQFGPWCYFFDRALHSGEFPTWNPLSMAGMPFAANPQAWAFYPPNLIRAVIHVDPTPAGTVFGLAVLAGLHLFLMAAGSFALARRHGLSNVASMLVFVAVAFNAAALRRVVELHFIFTLAWLPHLLLCVNWLVRAQGGRERGRAVAALSSLSALAILGGFPQIYAYLAIGVACYWLGLRLANPPASQRRMVTVGRDLLGGGVAAGLAAGLSMCMLLPAIEYLGLSPRAAGSGVEVGGYSPEAWNVEYVLQSLVLYTGRTWEPETLRGAGAIVLALSLFGLCSGPFRRVLPFALPLYALLDAMIGPPMPLSLLVEWTTPFQLVSATRAFDVAVLFMALVAGCGLDRLAQLPPTWSGRRAARSASGRQWVPLLAFVVSAYCVLGVFFWKLPVVTLKHSELVWVCPVAFAVVGSAWALLGSSRVPVAAAAPRLLGWVVILAVVGEVGIWCLDYTPRLVVRRRHQQDWTERYGFDGHEPLWPDNYRRTTPVQNYHLFGLEGVMNGYDPFHLHETKRVLGQPGKTHKYRRSLKETELPQRNLYGHLFAKRALWLVPQVSVSPMPLDNTPFAPTEVAFVDAAAVPVGFPTLRGPPQARWVSPQVDAEPLQVPRPTRRTSRGKRLRRYRFSGLANPARRHSAIRLRYASPTTATVFGYAQDRPAGRRRQRDLLFRTRLAATDEATAEATIALPDTADFDLRLDVVLDRGRQFELRSATRLLDRADAGAQLSPPARTADALEVTVGPLPESRLLAFIDADFPGWRVHVDGEPADLVRVNRGFKGVFLPSGTSRVRFSFHSETVRSGLATSLVCLVLLVVLALWSTRSPAVG